MAKANLKQRFAFDADQVEAKAIREGVASVVTAAIDETASGEAQEFGAESELDHLPFNQDEHLGAEELTGRALDAIAHRKKWLGSEYPFEVDRSKLTYSPSNTGVYEFCLATSLAASNPAKSHRQLLRHFERISCDLIGLHIGSDSVGVRLGFPTEAEIDDLPRLKGFNRKIDYLRSRCGFDEDEWTLVSSRKMQKLAARQNDARIDFVIRCPFLDDRAGGFTVIGQCGCGKNDVDESSRKSEQMTDAWLGFLFQQTSIVHPVKVFATSQHMTDDEEFFFKQGKSQSLFVDRIRLTLLASRHWDSMQHPFKNKIEPLTRRVL